MGARTQLTFYDERIAGAARRPGSDEILFTRDVGGNENFAGFVLDPASGRAREITEPGTRNESFIWSDDGAQLAWSYVPADESNYDVFIDAAGGARTRVFDGDGAVHPRDFSSDGTKLLLQRTISIAESQLFVLDVASKAIAPITPDQGLAFNGGEFTPDGRAIITISNEDSQFRRLVRIDLASGARQALTPELGWDVEEFDLSGDGRTIAYVINEAGRSSLRLMDARTLRALPAPALPAGIIGGAAFDDDGHRLGFTLNSATAPGDVYSWDLRARRLTRWTQSETGGIPGADFC